MSVGAIYLGLLVLGIFMFIGVVSLVSFLLNTDFDNRIRYIDDKYGDDCGD